MPGMQKPHWTAHRYRGMPVAPGVSSPSCSSPSIVVISRPADGTRDNQTRPHRLAVEQDVAGTADALIAAPFGAVQLQLIAQNIEQGCCAIGADLVILTVDRQVDQLSCRHLSLPSDFCAAATALCDQPRRQQVAGSRSIPARRRVDRRAAAICVRRLSNGVVVQDRRPPAHPLPRQRAQAPARRPQARCVSS